MYGAKKIPYNANPPNRYAIPKPNDPQNPLVMASPGPSVMIVPAKPMAATPNTLISSPTSLPPSK